MGTAIFKRLKKVEMECYLFDRFYRFQKVFGIADLPHHIIYEGEVTNIYLTHRLRDHQTRNLRNISQIQAVSMYIRPDTKVNVELLHRLKNPHLILAGLTPENGGLRIITSVSTKEIFSDPQDKYHYCYNSVLSFYKSNYDIPTPKSSSTDILGCVGQLHPDYFIDNTAAFQPLIC